MGRGASTSGPDGFTRLLGARRGAGRRDEGAGPGDAPEEAAQPASDLAAQVAPAVHEPSALPAEVEAAEWAVEEMSERTEEGYGPKRHEIEPEEDERRDEALRAAYDRHSIPVEHRKLGY